MRLRAGYRWNLLRAASNGATAFQPWKELQKLQFTPTTGGASMGPRPSGRGRSCKSCSSPPPPEELQWGHGLPAAEVPSGQPASRASTRASRMAVRRPAARGRRPVVKTARCAAVGVSKLNRVAPGERIAVSYIGPSPAHRQNSGTAGGGDAVVGDATGRKWAVGTRRSPASLRPRLLGGLGRPRPAVSRQSGGRRRWQDRGNSATRPPPTRVDWVNVS